MRGTYIMPVVGQIYVNRNGNEYCCMENTDYPNPDDMQKAVALGEHRASMVRMKDGWSIQVCGLQQYDDGAVEWNYSTNGAFRPEDLAKCRQLLRQNDPAMKKYFNYLDLLRMTGVTNMFGAVPYLQRAYPELAADDAKAREVLAAWMDSRSAH